MPSTISEIDFTTPSRKCKLEDEGQASDVASCDTCIHDVYSSIIDKDFILDKLPFLLLFLAFCHHKLV